MPAKLKQNGAKSTVQFELSADTDKLNGLLNKAAEALHSRGLGPTRELESGDGGPERGRARLEQVPFEELSNQQKADLLQGYIKTVLQDLVSHQRREDAKKAALDVEEEGGAFDE